MPTTLRDVAIRAGVSKSTVGYVLSGHPKKVSEELRQRILNAARELDYRPNENARALAKGKSNVIGVVPFRLENRPLYVPFVRNSLAALYDRAGVHSRHILLFTGYAAHDPAAVRARSFESRVDGIVLIAPLIGDEMLGLMGDLDIPVTIISNPAAGSIPHFNIDNSGGTRVVVEHLLSLGHHRIAKIAGRPDDGNAQERLTEFLRVMNSAGLNVPDDFVLFGGFVRDGGRECAMKILQKDPPPTAIVADNDLMAYGVYDAARELGLRIPEDLSVVGFDDDEGSTLVHPALTTVHQPIEAMAVAALDAVIRLADGEAVESQVFAACLVERESTSRPPPGL